MTVSPSCLAHAASTLRLLGHITQADAISPLPFSDSAIFAARSAISRANPALTFQQLKAAMEEAYSVHLGKGGGPFLGNSDGKAEKPLCDCGEQAKEILGPFCFSPEKRWKGTKVRLRNGAVTTISDVDEQNEELPIALFGYLPSNDAEVWLYSDGKFSINQETELDIVAILPD